MNISVASISSPEFINLQKLDLNPLMSKCEIKVLYLGKNRNGSYINKEVATEMSKTLRGAPIVGYYKQEKEDFRDHGDKIVISENQLEKQCLTKPYGFVSPDAEVWFQKFNDTDDFGNTIEREYLMTNGYLWTGQFEECKDVVDSGRPQSMEIDEETLKGRWTTDNNSGMEFFIINDATFSKLCILGNDVEPCFEGSSITSPNVSLSFSIEENAFKQELSQMIEDFKKYALKGGQEDMETNTTVLEKTLDTNTENVSEENNNTIEETSTEFVENTDTAFEKKEDKEKQSDEEETNETKEDDSEEEEKEKKPQTKSTCQEDEKEKKDEQKEDEEDTKKKYSLLQAEFENLNKQFQELETKYEKLVEFKQKVDTEKKDKLIADFYMLSDEDKKDVIENKTKYSYDEIESKLCVLCVRKGVTFDKEEKHDNEAVTTYNMHEEINVPAYITALRATQKERL